MHRREPLLPQPDYRALFEAAPGCYLVLLPDFTIVAVSDAYLKATMTRRDDIVGRGLFEVFPDNPADKTATGVSNLRASLQTALRTKQPDTMAVQKYDIRRPAADGGAFEERYWSPINTPVLDAAGNVAYIIHRVEDVTEFVRLNQQRTKQNQAAAELEARAGDMEIEILKRAQELQRLNKQLRDHEIFLDSIIENLPSMVFVKDAEELRFVLFNKAGENLLGYTRAELLGKNDYDFFPEEQADFFVQKDRSVLKNGELLDIPDEPIQTRHRGKRILHTKKIPIRDSNGKPVYLLGISEDITEARLAEAHIRELNDRLERNVSELQALNQELESFSYSVSHDLRAPLRGMNGFAQILLKEYEQLTPLERKSHLTRICAAAEKMALLIDGLLNLSRLTRQVLNRRTVDLSALARKIIDELKAADPARAVTAVVQDGLAVEGDGALLEIVLQNLLNNAWKFSSRKPSARIEVGREVGAAGVTYYVRDNGAGFDMEYRDKLFGPFQRLHSEREFDGHGIGLATVQRVIHRHGGKIWAESTLDQGATFYFTLGH